MTALPTTSGQIHRGQVVQTPFGWIAACSCGVLGEPTPYPMRAQAELIAHALQDERLEGTTG